MAGEAKHLFKAAWEELVSNRENEKQKTSSKLHGKTSASTLSSDDHDSDLQNKVKRTKLSASHALLKLFTDFRARRAGILKALTTEAERFYGLCDPG